MIELHESFYPSVAGFLPALQLDTVIAYSIVEKRQKGRIFVDNKTNPPSVLIWHCYGAAVLTGNCNNVEFNHGIKNLLFRRHEDNQQRITISIDSAAWQRKIEDMLNGHLLVYAELEKRQADITELGKSHVIVHRRLRHKLNIDRFKAAAGNITTPGKFILRKINKEIYPKITGRVVPGSFWASAEAFLKTGAGYCLMDGDKFACVSFSAYIGNGQIDVGIETNPEYRRRGLGAPTAAAMVGYCLDHGYQPVWGCLQDNVGSALIAKQVGFDIVGSHPVFVSLE
jgi:GNAT superfamily N-acetyltransferase